MIPVLLGRMGQNSKEDAENEERISDIETQLTVLVITATTTDNTTTLNRTFKQINDAFIKGKPMFVKWGNERGVVLHTNDNLYQVTAFLDNSHVTFTATSATTNPSFTEV